MLDFTKDMGKMLLPTTRRAWADLLILLVLLGTLNFFTKGVSDFGWLGMNPSPWLLVPLFLGARYGFKWGVGAGFLVGGIIFVVRMVMAISHDDGQSLLSIITDNLFFFLSLPGTGFITGETQGLLSKQLAGTEEQVVTLQTKEERLEADLDVAEETRFQLQEKLALFGAEHSNLDRQLRALFEPTAGAIFPNLLRLLRDIGAVTDAAVYAVDKDQLKRIGIIGEDEKLPETLSLAETEIAKLATERKCLTTVKELWQEAPDLNSSFIAALPWLGGGGSVAAILLIHRMQFLGTTWRNLSRIQMICRWVAQYVDLRVQASNEPSQLAGNTGALIVSQRSLKSTLQLAETTHREWQLPSTQATFEFTEPVTEQVAKLLPQAVAKAMRSTDVGSLEGDPAQPVFKVLMPMDGVHDAEKLLDSALKAIAKVPQLSGKVVANLSLTEDQIS
jgi:hypothetical protein